MPAALHAICADITTSVVDAIVNVANASLLPGGGVCGAIHRAAGSELAEECRLRRRCPTGDAKLTNGYRFAARYVIHTVEPVWQGGNESKPTQLASCYHRCLELAAGSGIATVAVPSISTGIYGYPIHLAAQVAVTTVRNSVEAYPSIREVIFCCYSPSDLAVYQQLLVDAC